MTGTLITTSATTDLMDVSETTPDDVVYIPSDDVREVAYSVVPHDPTPRPDRRSH